VVRRALGMRTVKVLACALSLVLLTSCSPGDDEPAIRPRGDEVVVSSFNFPESALVAEIYAQAIEAAGIPVRRELNLGPRELVQPALLGGHVDVVPEYLGSALATLADAGGNVTADTAAARDRLVDALRPWAVRVLEPSPAQNQNGLVVSRATAERQGFRSISDLARLPAGVTLAGPPECPQRPYCLPGLQSRYGLHVAQFVPFDTESQRATALLDEVVDVAVMFTTDGRLATGDLVLLHDDRALQPAENVVPVVSARSLDRYGARLSGALDAVSRQLTSNGLSFVNWRIDTAGRDIATEARGWLERHAQAAARP
jgi:osmoprotectant transport system substrate-binding protein